jgi:WD40 repeat protein
VWDAASGQQIARLKGHEGPVWSAAFSPDGARIVTASNDTTARVWDAASGQEMASLKGHEGPVWSAAFSPDGARIVTASADTTARVWAVHWATLMRGVDLRDRICREKLKGAVAFSVADAADPILSGLEGTRPCDGVGPLSFRYWAGVLTRGPS